MPTKILAIDDSKTMRLAIKITFAAEDAEVTSVGKGTEAVARAKQVEADVILLDAKLADGEPSGLELCRQLKSDAATAKIPVILLVSNQDPPAAGEVDAAGADDTVVKPFDSQDLIDKVAAVQGKPIKAPAAAAGFVKPAAPPTAPKPAAAPKPPVAARPAVKPPVAARPPVASKPRVPAKPPMAKPLASARSRVAPASPPPPVAAAKAARVSAVTEVGMPTPLSAESSTAAPTLSPPAGVDVGAEIPVAIPIPFTAASSPTPGILKRLEEAAGESGLDPKTAEALVNLSREVIERIVWEVVPDLAESIIKKNAQAS